MMSRLPPIFSAPERGHRIDTHQPLLRAVEEGKIVFRALGRGHYPGERLEGEQLPGALSVGFWDAHGNQDWGMDLHRNEGVEMCLVETGSMRFAVDGQTHPLRPGHLTITRPWQSHRQGDPTISASRLHWATLGVGARRPDQAWRWPRWVILEPSDRAELARRIRLTDDSVWQASPEVVRCFQHISAALEPGAGPSRLSRVIVRLNELLLAVLDLLRRENRAEIAELATLEHTVEVFLADVRRNPQNLEQQWTVEAMAHICGMSATHFHRVCRRLTNDSPMRFLNLARLETAAKLLRDNPRRSITEIALDCGFQSSQYFSYQFGRRFGMTPSGYREAD